MHQSPGVPQLHPRPCLEQGGYCLKEPREAAGFEELKWTHGKELPFWESNTWFFLENRTLYHIVDSRS